MKVYVNGKEFDLVPGARIIEVLNNLNINPDRVVVERNGSIIDRKNYHNEQLKEGDNVEIIMFVGGG
ncbi:MAG: sulfur carrier protein ThiS [Thermoplasmata archaeon]